MTQITLAVTGSISAYKAADITSQLTKLGLEVKVLMTPAARKFITPLTLQVLSKNPSRARCYDGRRSTADRAHRHWKRNRPPSCSTG